MRSWRRRRASTTSRRSPRLHRACMAWAWTLPPSQIAIAKKVFSPDPGEVAFARKILAAMPDGSGAVMIDGKMQDDATWKQARVIVELAKQVAAKDEEFAALYQF